MVRRVFAVLLTDRFFAGADTLATTYALATAIRKISETFGAPDIVVDVKAHAATLHQLFFAPSRIQTNSFW